MLRQPHVRTYSLQESPSLLLSTKMTADLLSNIISPSAIELPVDGYRVLYHVSLI